MFLPFFNSSPLANFVSAELSIQNGLLPDSFALHGVPLPSALSLGRLQRQGAYLQSRGDAYQITDSRKAGCI